MNAHISKKIPTWAAIFVGFFMGVVISSVNYFIGDSYKTSGMGDEDNAPLYWVAPMDANYRRDAPGLSPMGMDLIPVYDEGKPENDAGPGTIVISPDVVNSLGVRTGLVERRKLQHDIVTVGYVQFDEDKLIHIHPRVSGWIEKLYVTASGEPVKQGKPLYDLYSPELVNAQEDMVLAVNRKNTRLMQASEDRLRALQLPKSFIDELKTTLKVQQTVTFLAPQDGVVANLRIREGFFVQPGTTMLSIGSLEQIWVDAEIFERQVSLVHQNDRVTMSLDYLPGKVWEGRVDYIYPTLDKTTRTVRIRLRFDNTDKQLKPNMFAQINVHSDSATPLLLIPREALIRTGKQDRVVLALGQGSYKSLAVKVGQGNQDVVEIIKGLDEGDRVVTSAQFLLDSESSKTSDFTRLHHGEDATHDMTSDDKPDSVQVTAMILNREVNQRMVTAKHDAIAQWDWPVMTMNFHVADTVSIDRLTDGTRINMTIRQRDDGQYEITSAHVLVHDSDDKSSAQGHHHD